MVFIASNRASISSGLKGWTVAQFREEQKVTGLFFILCLLHGLELAVSESLNEHLLSTKQCLCNLFNLYEKFSKKSSKLFYFIKPWNASMSFKTSKLNQQNPTTHNGSVIWFEEWLVLLLGVEFTSVGYGCLFQYFKAIWHIHIKMEKKKRQVIDADVLLQSSIFTDT